MNSTPSAQPRRTHGPQGLRVELTGRATKWCPLSADRDVQSSPWSCEDRSRGMAGMCPEESGMPERTTRNSIRSGTRSQWSLRSNGVIGVDGEIKTVIDKKYIRN